MALIATRTSSKQLSLIVLIFPKEVALLMRERGVAYGLAQPFHALGCAILKDSDVCGILCAHCRRWEREHAEEWVADFQGTTAVSIAEELAAGYPRVTMSASIVEVLVGGFQEIAAGSVAVLKPFGTAHFSCKS
jgi:hypothetical protein